MSILETNISTVIVYPDRARLIRTGRLTLQEGAHRLEILHLPVQMNPDSARIAASGTARARLMGLQVQRVFYTETPAEQVLELEKQLEAAQDEMSALESQIALVVQSRARMDSLADHTKLFARALAKGEMKLEDELALFERLRQQAAQLDQEHQSLLENKRSLDRRIQQMKSQLDQARSARPRERYAALVELEVSQAGELALELTYVVAGAGWTPLYDFRLSEAGQKPSLEVGYLAQVTQQSGESWRDVSLTLSTARPALASTAPELEPWYIQPALHPVPVPPAAVRGMAMKAAAPQADTTALGAEMQVEAEEALASVEQSGAAVSYAVPGTVDIPSDGAAHKVVVARYALQPKLDYVTAPALVQAVYRRASAANESPYTLLPGKVNLFAADEFIGSTRLDLTPPQGEIELFLGVDDRLKVERELKRREVDKTIIGGKRRIRYGYEICLENLLDVQAEIMLHDRFPVARHEEIKVRLEACEPKPTRQSELSLLEWELELAAKGKKTIRFDFAVEYPQTMEIRGLP